MNDEFNNFDFQDLKNNIFDFRFRKNIKKLSGSNNESNCLYSGFLINGMNVKNHFIFQNLCDNMFYDKSGDVNSLFENYYLNIAKLNVGLISTGGIYIKSNKNQSNLTTLIDIENNKVLLKHKSLTNKLHSYGTKILLQLKPIYGRGDSINRFLNIFNYSSSNIKSYANSQLPCCKLSDYKCNEIIYNMTKLSTFSLKSGYDGIIINGDCFGIIGEFSSSKFNCRKYGYFSNFKELPLKIVKNIIKENNKINIFYSITIQSLLNDIYGNDLNYMETTKLLKEENTLYEVYNFIVELIKSGVDGFVFNFGTYENEFLYNFNQFQNEKLYFDIYIKISEKLKNENIKTKFDDKVAIIYRDNLNSLDGLDMQIKNGNFDLIDITRLLLSDNNFLKNNLKSNINNNCIKCGYCNYLAFNYHKVGCLINPETFDELKYNDKNTNHKIALIGSGISGLYCANYLAKRGFTVDLYEKNSTINKNGRLCEIFGFDYSFKQLNDYLENLLTDNINNELIKLKLQTSFGISDLKNNYHSIILATGFQERLLSVNGSILKNVKSIYEVLSDKNYLKNINNICIYARSELSIKLALYLLIQNIKVNFIIPNIEDFFKLSNDRYSYYFYQFKRLKASVFINAKINKIENDFVEVCVNNKYNKNCFVLAMNLKSDKKYKYEPKTAMIDSEMFIYEPEMVSNNKLFYDIVNAGYMGQIFMIGNALQPSDLADNIKSAYFVAKNL